MTQANPLARLESAHRMLAEARSIDEVKELRDKAEVARLYARERDLGLEAQNYAAEIKIRAERKLGELLTEMPKHPGAATRYRDDTALPPKLSDLGIDKLESSRWQQIASIPEEVFEQHIAEAKADERPLTTSRVVDLAKNGFDPSTLPPMRLSRAEHAYFAIPKVMQWLDVSPVDVADAADFDRLRADVQSWGSVVSWMQAAIREMELRQREPLTLVRGSA